MVVVRRTVVILVTGSLGFAGVALAQSPTDAGDPPSRVGRLAYVQGTVSFHDNDQTDWQPALLNTPITAGDALWTEPNAHSEVTIAGTRVRLDSATQLDMLALDDSLTRMQLDQGRIDVKTFEYDTRQPYEVVTPRGVVTIQQQGDYYVEAGSTQDATRLGVRQGAAQIQAPNGQTLAVRAGEVGELTGDGSAPQLHTIQAPPPPMPTYWAERDRQVVYDKPPQYLSASVTGYEDLNHYGTWQNDPEYGQVWYVNSPPSGWAPYTTGRWVSDPRYGWTWVDEQPWGFAPYHYGRWAQRNDRWFWVPPDRQQRAVYAPALVGFLGGLELGTLLGQQNHRPVGWFPLGPREVYVPPYATNRDYYRRINMSARIQDNILEDRWQRVQRREAIQDERAWMNRRYARIVAADDFARSRPVERSLIRVSADKLATAPVAAIAAPPRPDESIRALQAERRDNDRLNDRQNQAQRPGEPPRANQAQRPNDPREQRANERQALALGIKPEPEKAKAPGPQIANRADVRAGDNKANDVDRKDGGKQALPKLAPHNASAPPQPKIDGDRHPADGQAGQKPGEAKINPPDDRQNRPTGPDRADQRPNQPNQPGQANLPPVRDRNDKRPEPPRADDQRPGQPNQATEPKRPDNANRPDVDDKRPGQAQRPNDDTKGQAPVQRPAENRPAQPQPQRPNEDVKGAAPVQRPAENRPAQPQAQPNQAAEPKRAEPPRQPENRPAPPQQAQQPQRPPEAPKPPQAQPAPQPQAPAPQQQQQQQRDRQGMNTPAPQPQHQPAPQPQRQAAPQPQQHQPAPQPQPQPQRQAAPQQQQQSHPQQQAPQQAQGSGGQQHNNKQQQ